MPKDFKIGMLVGLVVVIGAGLWLSMHPSLSARARITGPENAGAEQEPIGRPSIAPNRPDSPDEIVTDNEQKQPKDAEIPKYHIVQDGETLSGISYKYYGSENQWQKILDTNRNVIKDVKDLRPGMKIIIPK
ncbi:MAG: LysM peptidoglycan-binding domain-containing protein [Planctomycetes bacterium]|nr:LysM peptidoglycan-binding domain-containing protein [Planctomycetota bacterium]